VLDFLPQVQGVTLDSLMAKLRPLGLSQTFEHTAGVFEVMPFRAESFDRVFLMNVLDHVRDPEIGLAEIARVLRKGGALVLSVDTYSGRRYWEKRARKWWDRKRGARTKHPWVFSVADIEAALRRTGFEPGTPTHTTGTKARRTFFTATKR
jgi:ubiquinone/menaquinone biosynthesis C-methylase UbiE